MLLSAEGVGHVPVIGARLVRRVAALLDILRANVLAAAPYVGADHAAGYRTTRGGEIVAAAAGSAGDRS